MRNAIVLAADKEMLPPAIWMWRTLVEMNPRGDTDIILVNERTHTDLWGLPVPNGGSVSVADLQLPDLFYRTDRRISQAAYWRLAIPRILKGRYTRALYLDIDVLPVSKSLFNCFDLEMNGYIIAAPRSTRRLFRSPFRPRQEFNSGIMLIDVNRYLNAALDQKAFELIRADNSSMSVHDQSVLNSVAAGQWIELSMSFNFWPGGLGTPLEELRPPKIIHYVGDFKPWHIISPYKSHPMRQHLLSDLVRHGYLRMPMRRLHLRRLLRLKRELARRQSSGENDRIASLLPLPALGDA